MAQSYNGWYASPNLKLRDLRVGDAEMVPGVLDDDDVYEVLRYVATQWHERVEPLVKGWCWGFNYRRTTAAASLSNHSSATAIDLNAPRHPFGVPASRNLSPAQIATCHAIIEECDGLVEWGGDYRNTPDAMHWDIKGTKAQISVLAQKIRNGEVGDEMKQEDYERIREIVRSELRNKDTLTQQGNKIATAVWGRKFEVTKAGKKVKENASALVKEIWARK